MRLIVSSLIPVIDRYVSTDLGIPMEDLMERSGSAVYDAIHERVPEGTDILIFAGGGNNGGDGYAAAVLLMKHYQVTVYDVFHVGQRSEEGKKFLSDYVAAGGEVIPLILDEKTKARIKKAGCLVDAIFGTGFHGEMPDFIKEFAKIFRETVNAYKFAIDVPLGVNPDDGSVSPDAVNVGVTVELSYVKTGIVSYPAKAFVGQIVFNDLGLPREKITEKFQLLSHYLEPRWIRRHMPHRPVDGNKGTFGKLLMLTGSMRYPGASALSLEAALRGGVGYVTYCGTNALIKRLSAAFPETLFREKAENVDLDETRIREITDVSAASTATLIGCGSDSTPDLFRLVAALIRSEGSPLLLDADAINAISMDTTLGVSVLKQAKRSIVLTPHPMEFSRLSGLDVSYVQQNRLRCAMEFAKEYGVVLVLKGAGTLVTDGEKLYVNGTGSSALAKAGSGDVLAGFMASLLAAGVRPIHAAALAVYFHGLAADSLSKEFSSFGVIPSDLPKQIAREIASFQ